MSENDWMWEDPEEALMFHARDGFYFERTDDAKVRVQHRTAGVVDCETWLTESEFASVMAHVSARGEDGATHREAEEYLSRQPLSADKPS